MKIIVTSSPNTQYQGLTIFTRAWSSSLVCVSFRHLAPDGAKGIISLLLASANLMAGQTLFAVDIYLFLIPYLPSRMIVQGI